MQLVNKKLRKSLAVAAMALATLSSDSIDAKNKKTKSSTAFESSETKDLSKWEFDFSTLYYQETDKVTAIEPVVLAKRKYSEERILTMKLALDVLTGASPNGASQSNVAQTFASPSGESTYSAAAGEVPLNDYFKDTRVAASVGWQEPLSRINRVNFGLNFSKEFDFLSYGGNLSYQHDLNNKNTTLNFGLSYEADQIKPVGKVPVELAVEGTPAVPLVIQPRRDDDESKSVIDVIAGFSQVFNRHAIAQFNYNLSLSDGYHTDPYKLFSVVDGAGATTEYRYENRPDSRMKHNFYGLLKYIFTRDILSSSYRLMIDDWGITSHTVDFRFRKYFRSGQYLEPHLRLYMQSDADFYSYNFRDAAVAGLEEATADYRLGKMMAYTVGLKYGFQGPWGNDMSAKAEYYLQAPDDEQPDLSAIMLSLSYHM